MFEPPDVTKTKPQPINQYQEYIYLSIYEQGGWNLATWLSVLAWVYD